MLCSHCCYLVPEYEGCEEYEEYENEEYSGSGCSPFPPPLALAHTPSPLFLWICMLWTFHGTGLVQYVSFLIWLLSLSVVFSRFLHTVACVGTWCLFMASTVPLCGQTAFGLSSHLVMYLWALYYAASCMCTTVLPRGLT